jgi:two-component system CheB/CheR fusion protein
LNDAEGLSDESQAEIEADLPHAQPRAQIRDEDFEALIEYLKTSHDSDFTGYKRQSLMRRFRRRMQTINLASFSEYKDYLDLHPDELTSLFNTILINVTSFFRDKPAWDYLAREIMPKIIASRKEGEPIRIWSAGCATGEEAYSIAMIVAEALGEQEYMEKVKIFATDIDESALDQARAGIYSSSDIDAVPKEMRDRYFERTGASYAIKPNLRRAMVFSRQDLLQEFLIPRLDLLICRNTLMYFNSDVQSKILARFHTALKDERYLFLGRAELLLMHTNLFTPSNLKCRMFINVPKHRIV